MLNKKYVVMPGVANKDGTWAHNTSENSLIDDRVTPMFKFSNYTDKHDRDDPEYRY